MSQCVSQCECVRVLHRRTYLNSGRSSSNVSPRSGLNGLPGRSELDPKALTAKAATYCRTWDRHVFDSAQRGRMLLISRWVAASRRRGRCERSCRSRGVTRS